MVIMTAKVSRKKIAAIALLLALIAVVLCILLRNADAATPEGDAQSGEASAIRTNEDRLSYLASFGWEVESEPCQTQEVRIPTDPSEVFKRYNALQREQGFDLDAYAGKTVRRYVYVITNYPTGESGYFATLLVYNNAVIGGDVCSSARGGVMHGLSMPKTTATAAAASITATDE